MSRLGASSYEHGDGGGSYGDYEHGVSKNWIYDRVASAGKKKKKTTTARLKKFIAKQDARLARARGNTDSSKYRSTYRNENNAIEAKYAAQKVLNNRKHKR